MIVELTPIQRERLTFALRLLEERVELLNKAIEALRAVQRPGYADLAMATWRAVDAEFAAAEREIVENTLRIGPLEGATKVQPRPENALTEPVEPSTTIDVSADQSTTSGASI